MMIQINKRPNKFLPEVKEFGDLYLYDVIEYADRVNQQDPIKAILCNTKQPSEYFLVWRSEKRDVMEKWYFWTIEDVKYTVEGKLNFTYAGLSNTVMIHKIDQLSRVTVSTGNDMIIGWEIWLCLNGPRIVEKYEVNFPSHDEDYDKQRFGKYK